MAGNRTEGRGTLSRTWRGALNAGIRAEGADDKLAYALRQTGLHPSCRPTWAPPRIDHNIDVRRGTNPQAKRTSSACARLIWGTDTGTGSQATVSTDPQQDRKVGSLAEIRQSSSQGRVTHRDLRGQLASRVRALVLAEGGNPAAGSHTGIRESARRQGQQGTKKAPLRRTASFPA